MLHYCPFYRNNHNFNFYVNLCVDENLKVNQGDISEIVAKRSLGYSYMYSLKDNYNQVGNFDGGSTCGTMWGQTYLDIVGNPFFTTSTYGPTVNSSKVCQLHTNPLIFEESDSTNNQTDICNNDYTSCDSFQTACKNSNYCNQTLGDAMNEGITSQFWWRFIAIIFILLFLAACGGCVTLMNNQKPDEINTSKDEKVSKDMSTDEKVSKDTPTDEKVYKDTLDQ